MPEKSEHTELHRKCVGTKMTAILHKHPQCASQQVFSLRASTAPSNPSQGDRTFHHSCFSLDSSVGPRTLNVPILESPYLSFHITGIKSIHLHIQLLATILQQKSRFIDSQEILDSRFKATLTPKMSTFPSTSKYGTESNTCS